MLLHPTASLQDLSKNTKQLLHEALKIQNKPIRRLGVKVSELSDVTGQLKLTIIFDYFARLDALIFYFLRRENVVEALVKKLKLNLSMGFATIGQLRNADVFALQREFGRKIGTYIYNASKGEDVSPVTEKEPSVQYSKILMKIIFYQIYLECVNRFMKS